MGVLHLKSLSGGKKPRLLSLVNFEDPSRIVMQGQQGFFPFYL